MEKPENNQYVLDILEAWLDYPQSDEEIFAVARWAQEMIAHLEAARRGDCNGDGKVDLDDLSIVSRNWHKTVR